MFDDVTADELGPWLGFLRLAFLIPGRLDSALDAHGLSLTEFLVLDMLAMLERRGGSQRIGKIAETAGVSPSTMSRVLSRMEQAGAVSREPSAEDRRVVVVALTTAGRAARDAAAPAYFAVVQDAFTSRLSPAQAAALEDVVAALDPDWTPMTSGMNS
ncbi:MarR family winged helix-turn-helix transcriptional regulator [Microbacterium sp. NPDC089698]|uniref:MarR family winged helix-turn-helix transcriptional regulator n=1 Tax=Microbacterium sp. NPDC089698 TaxID=3364200 RepID=UPI003812C773